MYSMMPLQTVSHQFPVVAVQSNKVVSSFEPFRKAKINDQNQMPWTTFNDTLSLVTNDEATKVEFDRESREHSAFEQYTAIMYELQRIGPDITRLHNYLMRLHNHLEHETDEPILENNDEDQPTLEENDEGVPASPSAAFDSPSAGGGGNGRESPNDGSPSGSPSGQRLAEAASELKRARDAIAQRDAQLTELRGKGREMLSRLKLENAELQRRLGSATASLEQAEESATGALASAAAAEGRAKEASAKAAAAEERALAAEAQVAAATAAAGAAEERALAAEARAAAAEAAAPDEDQPTLEENDEDQPTLEAEAEAEEEAKEAEAEEAKEAEAEAEEEAPENPIQQGRVRSCGHYYDNPQSATVDDFMDMGFTCKEANEALRITSDISSAVDFLVSTSDSSTISNDSAALRKYSEVSLIKTADTIPNQLNLVIKPSMLRKDQITILKQLECLIGTNAFQLLRRNTSETDAHHTGFDIYYPVCYHFARNTCKYGRNCTKDHSATRWKTCANGFVTIDSPYKIATWDDLKWLTKAQTWEINYYCKHQRVCVQCDRRV